MQITLKKANEIQRTILEAANKIEPIATVTVSPYSEKSTDKNYLEESVLKNGTIGFLERIEMMSSLMNAGYEIRHLLGEANAKSGINTLLTKRSLLEAKEKRLTKIIQSAEEVVGTNTVDEVVGRVQRFNASTSSYYDDIRLTIVNDDILKSMKATLSQIKQTKSDVTDQLAGLNLNTKITLSDESVEVLKGQGIIIS